MYAAESSVKEDADVVQAQSANEVDGLSSDPSSPIGTPRIAASPGRRATIRLQPRPRGIARVARDPSGTGTAPATGSVPRCWKPDRRVGALGIGQGGAGAAPGDKLSPFPAASRAAYAHAERCSRTGLRAECG